MEHQIIDNQLDSSLSEEIKMYLTETYKWTRFLSIVWFVMVGIMAVAALFVGSVISQAYSQFGVGIPGPAITALYLLIALIMFFPALYLFRFSSNMKMALHSGSNTELTAAFKNLKSHYKYIGIMTMIFLGLYGILFVLAIAGGLMA